MQFRYAAMKLNSVDILNKRRSIWKSKEILRRLYRRWYKIIAGALKSGKILELGGGSGNLKEFFPDTITTDIIFKPWLDSVLDAHRLPFKNESLDNIVLFDVLHHLNHPTLFFSEAERVLRLNGKIILFEPYISPASFFVYRLLHSEGMKWKIDPFKIKCLDKNKDPFSGNQAIPSLMFEKYRIRFKNRFPSFRIIKKMRTDPLIYPLSGGFHNPSICPILFWDIFEYFERLLLPVNRFFAFRIFIVIEKQYIRKRRS